MPHVIKRSGTVDVAAQLHDALLLLDTHGAILFRGFNVCTAADLAAALSTLQPNLTSMDDYFPAESGRDDRHVACGVTIWPTNSLRRTGGYLVPEVIPHSENLYALQAPRVVAFCCERAPWFGGDTALFDGCAAFGGLPQRLRARLAEPFCVRRLLSLERLHRRHGIGTGDFAAFAQWVQGVDPSATLRAVTNDPCDGGQSHGYVVLETLRAVASSTLPPPISAPVIASAPTGGVGWVRFNFGELNDEPLARHALLDGLLRKGLFSGPKWAVVRWVWAHALRHPASIGRLLRLVDALPCWLARPVSMLRRVLVDERGRDAANEAAFGPGGTSKRPTKTATMPKAAAAAPGARRSQAHARSATSPHRERATMRRVVPPERSLAEALSPREAEQLAASLAANVSTVAWQRGDMLLIDNAKVLHDGLPGMGPRKLHVALLKKL